MIIMSGLLLSTLQYILFGHAEVKKVNKSYFMKCFIVFQSSSLDGGPAAPYARRAKSNFFCLASLLAGLSEYS